MAGNSCTHVQPEDSKLRGRKLQESRALSPIKLSEAEETKSLQGQFRYCGAANRLWSPVGSPRQAVHALLLICSTAVRAVQPCRRQQAAQVAVAVQLPAGAYSVPSISLLICSTAMKASCGTSTRPSDFMRFFPAACFFSSFFLREMSPP